MTIDGNYTERLVNAVAKTLVEALENLTIADVNMYRLGYTKAVDDFVDRLSKYLDVENATKYGNKNAEQQINSYSTLMKYEIADAIDDVAEQLKEGSADNE